MSDVNRVNSIVQGLLGEKYGTIRIPGEVESSEFEMILDAAIEAKLETRTLEECYCRDENAVPPAYYLRPKTEIMKNHNNPVSITCDRRAPSPHRQCVIAFSSIQQHSRRALSL